MSYEWEGPFDISDPAQAHFTAAFTDDEVTPGPEDIPSGYVNGQDIIKGNTVHIRRTVLVVGNHPKFKADKPFQVMEYDGLGDFPGEPGMTMIYVPPRKPGHPIPDDNAKLTLIFSRKVGSIGAYDIRWRIAA